MNTIHQAYLWIGSETDLQARTITFLQKIFCKLNHCKKCVDCLAIAQKNHHALMWLLPENSYTVALIDQVHATLSFEQAKNTHYFFVLERADLLTSSTANSLLKSLEEPPAGYHFILLTPRLEGILPTVRSRCVIENFTGTPPSQHRLFSYFTDFSVDRSVDFIKELERERVPENEIFQLLDSLLTHWRLVANQAIRENNEQLVTHCLRIEGLLQQSREKPPMPGSSKLFLKNLYLGFVRLIA